MPALIEEIAGVRSAAADFARDNGVPDERVADLRLALSEAITNSVVHAFRDGRRRGTITVSVDVLAGRHVEITVRDDGVGMSPRTDSPGLGLGLPLIARVADETTHRTPPGGGFELWMRFRLEAV